MRIVLLALVLSAAAFAQDRPNVVLVYVDDMDLEGMEELDGLLEVTRAPGLEFTKGYIPNSICGPSRASLLTGTYNHTNEYYFNRRPNFIAWRGGGWEDRSFPVQLQQAGYYTIHVGKPVNGWPGRDDLYKPAGWSSYTAATGSDTRYLDFSMWRDIEGVVDTLTFLGQQNYRTDIEAGLAVTAMRRAVALDQPFFLYLPLYGPHAEPQTDPPRAIPAFRHLGSFPNATVPRTPNYDEADVSDKHERIRERFRITGPDALDALYQSRLQSMLAVEDAVRRVRDELEALGVADETYVFFISDNGLMLGHHRIRFSKGFPYERTAHVPFYVSGPGIAPGSRTSRLASIVDVAPTVLDLAGAPRPDHIEGRSLVPLLRGEDPLWRQTLLLEGWTAEGDPTDPYYRTLVTEAGVKYSVFPGTNETEAYDLRFDPYEIESAVGLLDAADRAAYVQRLDSLAACRAAECIEIDGRTLPRAGAIEGRVTGDLAPHSTLSIGWTVFGLEGDLDVALVGTGGERIAVGAVPVLAQSTEFVIPDSLAGMTVRVELQSAQGQSWTGSALSIATEPVTASFRAFPNPTTGRLSIALDVEEDQAIRVELFDTLGRRVRRLVVTQVEEQTRLREEFDLSGLSSGIYIVRAYGRRFSFQRQITILR